MKNNKCKFHVKSFINFAELVEKSGQVNSEKISISKLKNYMQINHKFTSRSSMAHFVKNRIKEMSLSELLNLKMEKQNEQSTTTTR